MQYYKGKMLTVDGTIYYPIVTWSHFKVNQILDETNVFYAHLYSEILPMYNPNRPRFVTFGDHQLFGIAHTAGFEVWSFDPKLQLAPDA
jgi:3'-phosphoadenosine 5'-phosphosulfate sulfotransferase (PAPS reductase)/FAD synthetase